MEVGLEPAMPTYSGGLGVLAGDTLHAAADLGVPMVGVTLLHRKDYFRQHLDGKGNQSENSCSWCLAFTEVMRSAIAPNGSFFNAQRMMGQYLQDAYAPSESREE
jgi:starch phosphorylase